MKRFIVLLAAASSVALAQPAGAATLGEVLDELDLTVAEARELAAERPFLAARVVRRIRRSHDVAAVPEPLTVAGAGVALGLGAALKRRAAR